MINYGVKNMKKNFLIMIWTCFFLFLFGCETYDKITDEEALSSIKNYCYENFPNLKSMETSNEYTIYWQIASSDEKEVVILFRSYTGAIVRYYINKISGETYTTEFMPSISEHEERTDEVFNINDYMNN